MRVRFTEDLSALLERINFNTNTKYGKTKENVSDGFEASDLRETKKGSCADFAHTKMLQLMEHGISSSSLGIALCRVGAKKTSHAVLMVSTTKGDYILDVLNPYVMTFDEAKAAYDFYVIPPHLTGDENVV